MTALNTTLLTSAGYGLRRNPSARPTLTPLIRFLFIDSRFCSTLPSDLPHEIALAFR